MRTGPDSCTLTDCALISEGSRQRRTVLASRCVGSNYANGFLWLITGTPGWDRVRDSPEDLERLLGWSGSCSCSPHCLSRGAAGGVALGLGPSPSWRASWSSWSPGSGRARPPAPSPRWLQARPGPSVGPATLLLTTTCEAPLDPQRVHRSYFGQNIIPFCACVFNLYLFPALFLHLFPQLWVYFHDGARLHFWLGR